MLDLALRLMGGCLSPIAQGLSGYPSTAALSINPGIDVMWPTTVIEGCCLHCLSRSAWECTKATIAKLGPRRVQARFAEMKSIDEARNLLVKMGAPQSLVTHVRLVGEAADLLLAELQRLGIPHDADFVRVAVVLHDSGKILHPDELDGVGDEHEYAGETLLLAQGVDPALARCCISHARWAQMPCSLEELVVALADTLWKGKRNAVLEKRVIDVISERLGRGFWDLFIELDNSFESIAANGTTRLLRSQMNDT
jgi:HD domain